MHMCLRIHTLILLLPLLLVRVSEQMDHTGFSHLLEDIYRHFHCSTLYLTNTLSKNVPLVKQDYLELLT